jgi:arsenite oxidase large subunit
MDDYIPQDKVPLPPPDAKVSTTACDYCIVGCGYKSYTWPLGTEGGPGKNENALGIDYPAPALSGYWISPNQHNVVSINGKPHNVVIIPDPEATVVNRAGNHSIRGGALAKKCYNPDTPTRDRLKTPLMRVNGEMVPVSWDTALDVMAGVSKHVIKEHGEASWGMKTYSYGYFENTYAISKLAFASVQTPAYAPHDKPGPGNDTAGIDDAGIIPFSASYEDWEAADVIFISGTDPYETKTVLFTEWMMKGYPKKIIMVNPRKTAGIAFAEQNDGLHLPVIPGTDTILHLALSRIILENGWEDKEWINKHVATNWEIESGFGRGTRNTPWQWRTTWGNIGTDYDGYKEWVLSVPEAELSRAAANTGIREDDIRATASILAEPKKGIRPKTSFCFEKGNYWSNNYLNTASLASLALLCGAGNRPGQMVSRLGGHQRGWIGAGSYPRIKSPEKFPGRRRKEIDLDRWVESGNLRFAYVIGTTWTGAMAASQELAATFSKLTRQHTSQVTAADVDTARDALIERVDNGGMVVVVQDIYLPKTIGAEIADIVLPASGWGEDDFTRCNGERRLRLYSKIYDAPGESKSDWRIIAEFAKRMGYEGYDWKDSNDVFEEAARFSRGGVLDYYPLVYTARQKKIRSHEMLRSYGTTGIQTPIRLANGVLEGTKRLHDSTITLGTPEGPTIHSKWLTHFKTHSGKALMQKTPWSLFSDFYERITPKDDELWITGGRINEIWQSGYDDSRRPYIMQRWPEPWLEIHPSDAEKRGIENGDWVSMTNNDILIQTGGFVGIDSDDMSFTSLEEQGKIRIGQGECKAVAIVTDAVRPGVVFTNFLDPKSPSNNLVHRVPDPITNRYRFKLGKGRIEKIGESKYKHDLGNMSFASRTIVGKRHL